MQGLIGVIRLMLKHEQQPAVPKHNKYLSGICTFAGAAKNIKTTGNVHFKVRKISKSVYFCSLHCYENRAHSYIHRPRASLEHLGIRWLPQDKLVTEVSSQSFYHLWRSFGTPVPIKRCPVYRALKKTTVMGDSWIHLGEAATAVCCDKDALSAEWCLWP